MAIDKSEPRIGLIVGIGLLSVSGLLGLRTGLQAYFLRITEREQQIKVFGQPPLQLRRLREAEQRQMSGGPIPIEQAIAQIASGVRPAAVVPAPSTDWAPLQGWTQLPVNIAPSGVPAQVAPTVVPPAPAPAPAETPGRLVNPSGLLRPSDGPFHGPMTNPVQTPATGPGSRAP
jgi:hypothetical protein